MKGVSDLLNLIIELHLSALIAHRQSVGSPRKGHLHLLTLNFSKFLIMPQGISNLH